MTCLREPGAPLAPMVYFGLGSNLGDRLAHLRTGLAALGQLAEAGGRSGAVGDGGSEAGGALWSAVFESAPMYVTGQPSFLNLVARCRCALAPAALLRALKGIEAAAGRQAGLRFGPRPLDIDILFYDGQVLESAELTIPHPRLGERRFVLEPLAEIAPALRHPVLGETVAGLLARLPAAPDQDCRRVATICPTELASTRGRAAGDRKTHPW